MSNKTRRIGWLTIIPIIFWIICMILSVRKLFQTGNDIHIIDWLDIINSNTFSTFISMVIGMAYQFFSVKKKKQQEKSGLSRKYIPLTIISSALYGVVAVVNACTYCLPTAAFMTVASVIYVFLFFQYMIYRGE